MLEGSFEAWWLRCVQPKKPPDLLLAPEFLLSQEGRKAETRCIVADGRLSAVAGVARRSGARGCEGQEMRPRATGVKLEARR